MADEKKKKDSNEIETVGRIGLGLIAIAVAVSLLIPTVLGVLVFFVLAKTAGLDQRRNRRYFIFALLILFALSGWTYLSGAAAHYFSWLVGIFGLGETRPSDFPLAALGIYTLFVTSLIGALGLEWIQRHTPEKMAAALHLPATISTVNVDPEHAHRIAGLAKPPSSLTKSRSLATTSDGHDPDSERIVLGVDANREPVYIHTHDLSMHGMVLGTTGSGKTVTLKALLEGMLDLGYSGCVLDLKEDIGTGGLAEFLETYSFTNGINYQHWALSYEADEFNFYLDPLTDLDQDLALNVIVSMQDFEAPHWEMMCKQMLGQLLDLMYQAHEIAPEKFGAPNLRDIGRIFSGDVSRDTQSMRATVLNTHKQTGHRREDDYYTLATPSPEHRQASKGLGARISAAYESKAGRTGLRPDPLRKPIRLADPGIVYIGLDSLGKADTSRVVSSSVLGGYAALASRRKDDPRVKAREDRRFLVIDEANTVNTTMVMNLLSRARSSGITVILATQGAIDWGDDWNAMVNNTNFSIIMGQQDPESARRAAEVIGHIFRTDESQSLQDGEVIRTNRREVEDYQVPPENLRRLERGQAYIRVRERYGSPAPFLSWLYVYYRGNTPTTSGYESSAARRIKPRGGPRFETHLPDFTQSGPGLAPPPGSTPPSPRTQPPAPRRGQTPPPGPRTDSEPEKPAPGGWNPAQR